MIRTIVFDMDGVLIDTETLSMKYWGEIGKAYGIENLEQTLHRCIGVTSPESEAIFEEAYGKDFPYQKYRAMVSQRFQACMERKELPVKPGVYELFSYLKENGYTVALASSTRSEMVKKQMALIGLLDYFDVLVCGDMVSCGKPNPEIYLKACQLLKTEPSLCYAVEDSFNGIRSASRAGMKPIMVPDLLKPDKEIKGLYYKECASLLEVLALLQKGEL